ncbi:hypothetical protein [Actinokineospora bangkokensis]|uniref:Uncharacterized protein n=1 Tax=Actinokineospora bangkokensis TaxID=1193682 RepID=A0A1Q9LC05_9PSEU|nr:hypothetical protein [Actinokineospora bangkokensis]OLR89550.1 hypothetical protein BJP25_05595 [Actinokineospora bangkokensis]
MINASREPSVAFWTRQADAIQVGNPPKVQMQPRLPVMGQSYVEQEYAALAAEQPLLWSAEGELAARRSRMAAEQLGVPASASGFLLEQHQRAVTEAQGDYHLTVQVLAPYVCVQPKAKLRYWVVAPILALGDAVAVWSTSVAFGEVPEIAFGQALAAGLAAGAAGLVGSELRNYQLAKLRQRDLRSLSADEQRFARFFTGTTGGFGMVKLVGGLSLVVTLLVAVGIGLLRASVEGAAAGLTFGLLAAATAVGSALLGYSAADEVADQIDRSFGRWQQAMMRHQTLASCPHTKQRARAMEAVASIRAEHELRGTAASKRVDSLAFRVQRRQPQVFGHGAPAGEVSGQIGRRPRRGDRS